MRHLRALSGRTLAAIIVVAALAVVGAAVAVAASGGKHQTPAPKPVAQAVHEALAAAQPPGITARVTFTNKLFPSGSLLGSAGSALMSGATGRLWLTNDGRGRIELQSDAGDVQVVWSSTAVSVYDASANTVYRLKLPADKADKAEKAGAPTLAEIQTFLTKLADSATVSGAHPTNVADRPAYSVSVSPKHDGGLLGSAELAWDAAQGVPLRIGVYAAGASSPVLQLKVTQISYAAVPSSDVDVSPPAGAKTVDLGSLAGHAAASGGKTQVTGLDAVRAAAGFPVLAPDTLVGLPRKDVRLVGGSDNKAVLVVYGQGLGAIAVLERTADASGSGKGGPLSTLPAVSLDGVTGHELATQLGTVLQWQRTGVAYVLAGSLPPAAAEAAARELK